MAESVPLELDDKDVSDSELEVESIDDGSSTTSGSETSSVTVSSGQTSVVSLLTRLRSSELSRKRKIKQNVPPTGLKKGKGRAAGNPKNISPGERVTTYSGEPFIVNPNKNIFCSACREELSTKKSIIEMHIKSQKHLKGKTRLAKKNERDTTIVEALKHFDSVHHPAGENLPESTRVYRVKVVTAMLKAGVALSKTDSLRDLLEEHGYSLSSSTHLRQLVPFILHEKVASLKEEIAGRCVSIVFDGTTHVCEAMVVVLRYVADDWKIKQKVARLMLLAKSMTGEEVARQIMVLSTELGIASHLLVAAMRDRASVNSVAMRTVSIVYNQVMDIGCFSHTLDHVGEHMQTPILDDFVKSWIGLFSQNLALYGGLKLAPLLLLTLPPGGGVSLK